MARALQSVHQGLVIEEQPLSVKMLKRCHSICHVINKPCVSSIAKGVTKIAVRTTKEKRVTPLKT